MIKRHACYRNARTKEINIYILVSVKSNKLDHFDCCTISIQDCDIAEVIN